MSLPVIAIVGRPNVGKSSLFNWLAGRRISIVDPTAGVTRDRVTASLEVTEGRFAELVDTGGMGIEDMDDLTVEVENQIRTALTEADIILFVVDVRDGIVPLDEEVASRLRLVEKPVILVANKCDTSVLEDQIGEFHRFGFSPVLAISAEQKRGWEPLMSEIVQLLPEGNTEQPPEEAEMKLAIVGRRNAGKSTFINVLAESERVIVSEVPGTTRDSIDVRFEHDGKSYLAIDTAGVRRKKSLANDIEWYSMARAERSIRRADVVLHFFDARLRVGRLDKQLAEYYIEQHKPVVFVINKWDLVRDKVPTEYFGNYVRATFPMLDFVPIAFITATKGKNVQKLLSLARHLHKQASRRVNTGELNRVLREALTEKTPPIRQNRQPKIYYATQADVTPPNIILFTNGPQLFEQPYLRYLTRRLRDSFHFGDVPIRLSLRDRTSTSGPDKKKDLAATIPDEDEHTPLPDGIGKDLPMDTTVTEDDSMERDRKKFNSGVWKDL